MLNFWSTLFLSLPTVVHLLYFSAAGAIFSKADRATVEDGRKVSRELYDSLEELSRITDITYCLGNSGVQKPFQCLSRCDEFEGFELVTKWNTGPLLSDSCGYIALSHSPYPKRIIVAFRGTYSITNAVVDLSVNPQPYAPYTGKANETDQPRCSGCTVHAGFMAAWQNTRSVIFPYLQAARKQHPDYDLVLVGHSLGGAVAALAGLEMQLRGWNPQVTTFGEPRVGNDALASYFNKNFDDIANSTSGFHEMRNISNKFPDQKQRYRRVTHANDLISLLPLEEWGYKMHGGEIFISKPDLPPSVSDLEHCYGNEDSRCIAGVEAFGSLGKPKAAFSSSTGDRLDPNNPVAQAALINKEPNVPESMSSDDDAKTQSLLDELQRLIPTRLKIWELVFAHRDYFWRIGLCVPGGDRTRFRADVQSK